MPTSPSPDAWEQLITKAPIKFPGQKQTRPPFAGRVGTRHHLPGGRIAPRQTEVVQEIDKRAHAPGAKITVSGYKHDFAHRSNGSDRALPRGGGRIAGVATRTTPQSLQRANFAPTPF